MATSAVKVGLLGYGYWGKNLARALHQLGVLGAICDTDFDRAEQARADYNLSIPVVSTGADALMRVVGVERVAIATPPETHYALAKEALTRGLGVFVEKPLATKYKEARELEDLARTRGLPLLVGHIYLHCPGINMMPVPVGCADLYISLLNPEGPPNGINRDITWAALPHAASLALLFFSAYLQVAWVIRDEHRIRAKLEYWNGSQVFIDVGDFTGRQERKVELRDGPVVSRYDGKEPNQCVFFTSTGWQREGIGESKEPLLLEMEQFLSYDGVDPLGAKVVKLVEEIIQCG